MATIQERKKKSGKITYTVTVRVKGYKSMSATFDRLTDARVWANSYETDMKRGKKIKDVEARKHTLAELIDRYLKEKLNERGSDKKDFETQANWWKEKIGHYLLSEVTPSLISQYKIILHDEPNRKTTKNPKPKSEASVNRYLACLSTIFSVAYKEWEWVEENPVSKVAKYKEPDGRVRFLTDEEQKNLLQACSEATTPLLYLIVVLALYSGARKNELLSLTWKNVIFDDKGKTVTLKFMHTKNGEKRSVNIDSLAYNLLKEHSKVRKINSVYVFSRPDGKKPYDIRKQWENAREKAGLEDFRFHDLRHTTASRLAMNGAGLLDIAEVLGHKTLKMVKRYSHLTKKHSTKILANMNEKYFDNP